MADQIVTDGLLSREATPADLELIVRWEADPDTERWLGPTGRDWHERVLADPTQMTLVTTDFVTPVGFTVFARMDEDGIELRRIVVDPERRGIGWGRRLLRAMLVYALDGLLADAVWLDVKRDNTRARELYESEGFAVVRSLADRPNADGTSSELVIMSRRGPYRG